MPVYTYRCECGRDFDKIAPISAASEPQTCPDTECQKLAPRVMSAFSEHNSSQQRSANFPKRKRYTNW